MSVGISIVVQLTSVSCKETKDDDAIAKEATLPPASGVSGSTLLGTNPSPARFFAASAIGM